MLDGNSGPIPGENYTSDTKNYPWRQPPEYSDLDDALDFWAKKITDFKVANGVLTMAEMGFPLYKISSMLLMNGVGEGKWTPDFALLLAGPLTRMIELVCVGFKVDYDLGIDDDEDDFETGSFFKEDQKLRTPDGFKLVSEELPDLKAEAEGQAGGEGEQSSGVQGDTPDLQQQGFMAMTSNSAGPEGKKETK